MATHREAELRNAARLVGDLGSELGIATAGAVSVAA
jgi:hypothetical protein